MTSSYATARLTARWGNYLTGSAAACLTDGTLHSRALEYKRRLSNRMAPVRSEELKRRVPPGRYLASRKMDGEFTMVIFNGETVFSVNPGGTVRVGLPCYGEAADLLKRAGVRSATFAAELYCARDDDGGRRPRVHAVVHAARSPSSDEDLRSLKLAIFDVLEIEGQTPTRVVDIWEQILKLFKEGQSVHPVEAVWVETLEEAREKYDHWVVRESAEGLVLRSDGAGWFKIKPSHTVDAAVIGFTEGLDERRGMLHDLLVALMRVDGSLQIFCRVGGGFTDAERRDLLSDLRDQRVESDYVEVNRDHVGYEMVEPKFVIELNCLDMISENTRGAPINKMVLGWKGDRFEAIRRMPSVSVISPQFIRLREDKQVVPADVRISQVTTILDLADADVPATESLPKQSELIHRSVYTKSMKGNLMVRKLVMWQTHKDLEFPDFPAFVVYLTDFSPGRKTPLEREIRVAKTFEQAESLFEQMAALNFLKGWTPAA